MSIQELERYLIQLEEYHRIEKHNKDHLEAQHTMFVIGNVKKMLRQAHIERRFK